MPLIPGRVPFIPATVDCGVETKGRRAKPMEIPKNNRRGMSSEVQVNIGLRQGSALSPLLFIVVMGLISRKGDDVIKRSGHSGKEQIGR